MKQQWCDVGKSPAGRPHELTAPSLKQAPSPKEHKEAILYVLKSPAHFQEPSLLSSRIASREFSVDGNGVLQLFNPVQHHVNLRDGRGLIGFLNHQKALPVGAHIEG